jgi:adenylate kinase family enzyme
LQRIVVLGCAGSGKTTLARRLAKRIGAPVIVLDEIWQAGWGDDDIPGFRALIEQAHTGEAWVSDGNFAAATFDLRLPRADTVIWLDRPRWRCAWRAVRRLFRPGETHRLADLPRVLAFIHAFDHVNRPRIEALRQKHGPQARVVRLTSDRQADTFINAA